MNDSFALLQARGELSSSVDPSSHQARAVENFMKTHGHPPFPDAWCPYNRRGQRFEAYHTALGYFYKMFNGMGVLYDEICKCVIRTAIPSELIVVDIQDQIFDAKALRKGEDCPMTEDQKEGMKGENMDTVTGLLLHTMSECYFKKGDIIDKVAEIQRWHKRFSEFSIAELTEIETSLERRSEEIIPAFDECLAKLNEKELHEGYKNLFIWTWKLHAMFSDNESKGVEKMNEVTQKYSEATKASEDKINILSNEMKKMKAKCTSCEKKIAEYKESTSKYKKLSEQQQKKLKESTSEVNDLLQENKSYQQINYEIQNDRAQMQTIISRLRDDYKLLESDKHRLESANKQALERETLYTTKVQSLESDISEKENILRQLQDERTHIKAEFKAVHANKESLLTRLSEVAGAKLTEGNTEITDLSDPNRPTKIGERFREIYDNEWTEALEELTSKCVGITDRIAVEFLLNVMMKSFRFCSETLRIQADNCYRCFEEFPAPRSKDLQISMGERDTMPTISLKGTMRKRIDGIRKGVLSAMEPVAKETLLSNGRKHLASRFNSTFKYIYDVLSINNPNFKDHLQEIYPHKLEVKEITESDRSASYLDILIYFYANGHLDRCLANINIQLRMLVHQVSDSNVAEIQSQAAGLNIVNEDDQTSSSNEAHGMPQEQGYATDSLNQSWKQGKCQEKTITTEEKTQNSNSSNAVSESFEFRTSHSSSPNGNSQQAFNESEDDKKKDSAQDRDNVAHRDCIEYNLQNDPKSSSMYKDGNVNISSADELRTETEVSVPSNGSRYVEMSLVHDSKSKALDEEIVKTNEKHSENEDSYKRNENQSENGGVEQSGKRQSRKVSDSDEMGASFKELSKVLNFSGKCFDLCWLMRTHSPELHLDEQIQKGSEFDPNRFRHYTQTGKKVEFVVWPALHLYEGGPLLAKGVAQPIKDKNKNNSAQQQT